MEDLFLGGQWSIILGYRRLSVKSLQVLLLIPFLLSLEFRICGLLSFTYVIRNNYILIFSYRKRLISKLLKEFIIWYLLFIIWYIIVDIIFIHSDGKALVFSLVRFLKSLPTGSLSIILCKTEGIIIGIIYINIYIAGRWVREFIQEVPDGGSSRSSSWLLTAQTTDP